MAARALVVMDYQNIHLTGHGRFAPAGLAKHESLVHPLHFGRQVVAMRNHRIMTQLAAGRTDLPPQAELAGVAVFRGLPSQKNDPDNYRRNMAQRSEWTRDRLVEVTYRTLNYRTDPPREKGVDVLVALRVVRAAELNDVDVVILASHDTDLEPALEDAALRGTCQVETAGWQGCKVLRPGPKLWHTTLGATEFVRSRDRKVYS